MSKLSSLKESAEAQIGLPIARRKWEAQNITHYSFEIWASNHVCLASARVEVKDGKVVRVNFKSFESGQVSKGDIPPNKWTNPYWPHYFSCDYSDLTIPYLFHVTEQNMLFDNTYLSTDVYEISFNLQYGFISKARFGNLNRRGLFGFRGDCCIGFNIENFQLLEK